MATSTPVIIAVSVLLAVMFIGIIIFLFVYCSRRVRPGTNVRKRFIPRAEDERAIVQRVTPPSPLPPPRMIEIPRVRRIPPPEPPVMRALPPTEPPMIRPILPPEPPMPEQRVVTEIVHRRDPTPPPPRRDDWVLVKRHRRRRRNRQPHHTEYVSSNYSHASSSDDEDTTTSQHYRGYPWQRSMFYQQGRPDGVYPYGQLDRYDLAMNPTMQLPYPMFLPEFPAQPMLQPQLMPARPITTSLDDSAIPNLGAFQWINAAPIVQPAVVTAQITNYETKEGEATFD